MLQASSESLVRAARHSDRQLAVSIHDACNSSRYWPRRQDQWPPQRTMCGGPTKHFFEPFILSYTFQSPLCAFHKALFVHSKSQSRYVSVSFDHISRPKPRAFKPGRLQLPFRSINTLLQTTVHTVLKVKLIPQSSNNLNTTQTKSNR